MSRIATFVCDAVVRPAWVALRLPAAVLTGAANAAVGGQAVLEGVMMRSPNHWAVAIRRHTGDIVELHRQHRSFARRHRWARLPILRGVVALGSSLIVGFRALSVSAHYASEWAEDDATAREHGHEPRYRHEATVALAGAPSVLGAIPADVTPLETRANDEHAPAHDGATPVPDSGKPDEPDASQPESLKGWQIAIAFVFAIGFSVLLFKLTPALITNFAFVDPKETGKFVAVEGLIRVSMFVLYLTAIGFMPDMKRVFQYHSAEHKAINAWEAGAELTPERVNEESRIHVRCGTAFMLWVFVVGIIVFGIFGELAHPTLPEIIGSRVIFLPLIAGVSFELIKFAGKYPRNVILRGVLAPGLWLQRLTTRECTPEQCAVAIRSLQLVLEREFPNASPEVARRELADPDEAMQVMA